MPVYTQTALEKEIQWRSNRSFARTWR